MVAVHRDPRSFSPDPTAFWPERWLPQEGPKLAAARGLDFQLDTGALITFGHGTLSATCLRLACLSSAYTGPTNCVGRAVAMNEMRVVIAALVRGYDMKLAPGFEPKDWTDNLGDRFVATRGKLMVEMKKREE
jgi:cytochrome P450